MMDRVNQWGGDGAFRAKRVAILLSLLTLVGLGNSQYGVAQQWSEDAVRAMGPMTLSEVVGAALDQNRDIVSSRHQLNLANEQVSEAWSSVYPSVDFNGSFTRNVAAQVSFLPAQIFDPSAPEGEFIPVQFGADNIWNLTVVAEQPLLRAGAFVGVGAAAKFRGLQQEVLRGQTQQVVTRVRIAFFDLLLAQEEVRLIENSLERVAQSLEETRALNRAGLAQDYDVLRLEVEYSNLEPNVRRAQNRQEAARRRLGIELSLPAEAPLTLAGNLAELDLQPGALNSAPNQDILEFAGTRPGADGDADQLIGQAAVQRSDVRQLALTEELREAELRVEQAEYLPEVTAFGTYGLAAQQNGSPDFFGGSAQRASTKQLGVRVSFPLFSGFRRDARIDQKQAALRQAETQTSVAQDQAAMQVRNLIDDVEEALARAQGQGLAVQQANRGFEIASAQYREGLGTQLELTDAEVALRQSEFNYAQAVYDYLTGRAQLDEAVGRVPLVDSADALGGDR